MFAGPCTRPLTPTQGHRWAWKLKVPSVAAVRKGVGSVRKEKIPFHQKGWMEICRPCNLKKYIGLFIGTHDNFTFTLENDPSIHFTILYLIKPCILPFSIFVFLTQKHLPPFCFLQNEILFKMAVKSQTPFRAIRTAWCLVEPSRPAHGPWKEDARVGAAFAPGGDPAIPLLELPTRCHFLHQSTVQGLQESPV